MELHAQPRSVPSEPTSWLKQLLVFDWRSGAILIFIGIIFVVFNVFTDGLFLSERNLVNLSRQIAATALLAMGMVLILLLGNINLGVGSAMGLCGILAAVLQMEMGVNPALAIGLTLLFGLILGAVEGILVAWLRIPAFVVTLGGLLAYRGAGMVLTEARTISPLTDLSRWIGQGYVAFAWVAVVSAVLFVGFIVVTSWSRPSVKSNGRQIPSKLLPNIVLFLIALAAGFYVFRNTGIPVPVFLTGLGVAILTFFTTRTRFGRYLYAIGGNREAATLAGINVPRHVFATFVIMGLLSAVAGLVAIGRLNGAPPNLGFFKELDAIAAAVIGGTSLYGGRGRVSGAILGATLLESVSNGLTLLGVITYYQYIVAAIILILAALFDTAMTKSRTTH